MNKIGSIAIIIVAIGFCSLALLFGVKGCENGARSREKLVERQLDFIAAEQENLVNSLRLLSQNAKFGIENEKEFQKDIAQLRSKNAVLNDSNIRLFIQAVHENPPAWASIDLLKDISVAIQKYNENVARAKKSYRTAVQDYEFYTEKWPNASVLSSQGYGVKTYDHINDDFSVAVKQEQITDLF